MTEVLALDVLIRGRSELVVGTEGVSARIVGIEISGGSHVGPDFEPGNLWLASAASLGSEMRQRLLVQELIDAGASGLVFQMEDRFTELPAALLQEALERHLPIILVKDAIRPADIARQLDAELAGVELKLMKTADKIGRCFSRMVLQGGSLDDVMSDLSEDLGHPVVLEDVAHQIVTFARRTADAHALASWEAHSRVGHKEPGPGSVHEGEGTGGCLWIDLRIRGEVWGRLHVLHAGRDFQDLELLVADRGATAISMLLLGQASMEEVARLEKSRLMLEFLQHRVSAEEFTDRLGAASFETRDKVLGVVALRLCGSLASGGAAHPQRVRAAQDSLLTDLRGAVTDSAREGFTAVAQGTVYVVLAASDANELDELARHVAELVLKKAAARETRAAAGISTPATRSALRRAVWEADQAVSIAADDAEGRRICKFRDMGIQSLLMSLDTGPELASFVEAELGALLSFDASAKTPLLPTLGEYLAAGAQKLPAARQLHIDRRTLYQRLSRIEDILGPERLSREEDRARIWLAIQGLKILRQRSRGN